MGRVVLAVALFVLTTAGALTPRSVALDPAASHTAPVARVRTDPAVPSTIEVSSVDPAVATPGSQVTVSGVVHAGSGGLSAARVRAIRGLPTLSLRPDVASWAASQSTDGVELTRQVLPGSVPPGGAVPFSLTVDAADIALTRTHGAVPLAIQLLGGGGAVVHTFVGWNDRIQYEAVQLAWVVPLTLDPTPALFSPDAATRAAAWTSVAAPEGRLSRIVSATEGTSVAWAVDPAILGRDRATSEQGNDPQIRDIIAPLVARLAAGASGRTVLSTAYGDPDVTAVRDSALSVQAFRELDRDADTLSVALGSAVTSGVLWPADGGLPSGREKALRALYPDSSPTGVLVSASSLPIDTSQTTTAAQRTMLDTPLLAWDDRLSTVATRTGTPTTGALAAQEFLAETAMISLERPGVAGRTVLVALPRDLDPDPAALAKLLDVASSAPWVAQRDVADVLTEARSATAVERTDSGSWGGGGTPVVGPLDIAWVQGYRSTVASQAQVVADGGAFGVQWQDTLDQLTSTRWRSHADAWEQLRASIVDATGQVGTQIEVQPQTTNFLADEGVLRITIVNGLPQAVDGLTLHLTPANARLRIDEPADAVRIEGNSRATVQVSARAVAAGLVPVTAWLTGPDGRTVGQGATLTVRANPPGVWLYVIGGVLLGAVLLIGLVRALRRSPPPPPPGSEDVDPVVAVPEGSDRGAPLG